MLLRRSSPRSIHLLMALAFSLLSLVGYHARGQERYTIEKEAGRVDVLDQGSLVTSYHFRSGSKPILWPLIGPDAKRFSREYPMVPDSKDEEHDHPHHRSLWMTFGEINEFDLWAEGKGKGTVCQVGDPEIQAHSDRTVIRSNHLWKAGSKDVSSVSTELQAGCSDSVPTLASCESTYVIRGNGEERIIDCFYQLHAKMDLHFGDTKEGMFAIRVPEPMRADKRGGHILSSEGRVDGATWGFPAKWVDYSGKTLRDDDKTYGIAILIHPDSYRSEGRWHVRTYGLFAHNPFGVKDFPKIDNPPASDKVEGYHLESGERISFAYRVILHRNAFDKSTGDSKWQSFANAKISELAR